MYYLEEKQFKPAIIMFSILFIPIIVAVTIAISFSYQIELLVILFVVILVYLTLTFIIWRISARKTYYLQVNKETINICYPNINNENCKLELLYKEIKKIDYYKITSLAGWMMLFNYAFPKCVFITYVKNGKEKTDFIGYLDLYDIKQIANNNQIQLVVH